MTRKEKIKFKKTILGAWLLLIMVVAMFSVNITQNIKDNPDGAPSWHWIQAPTVWATNESPGASTAGIVQICTLADAFSSWDTWIPDDDANIYEESDGSFTDASVDAPHEELIGTTPFETDFHIAVSYQFTEAMAYDAGSWNASRVYAIINTTGFTDDASTVTMSEGAWYDSPDANTKRINFYLLDDDGGADDANPLQIAIDSTWDANVTIWYYG